MTKGEIVIIGATTEAEYNKHIMTDKAFARRFRKILVQEPTKEETINILKNIKPEYDTFFSKEFKEEAIRLSDEIGNKKAAMQLGIPYYTLADWRNRSKHKPKETVTMSEDELRIRNRELERENAELREANNILKDALGFFAKDRKK